MSYEGYGSQPPWQQGPSAYPPQSYPPVPPKKRPGLIIGVIAAVILLISVGIATAFIATGNNDNGGSESKKSSQPVDLTALMARIRATDPCALHNLDFLKRFGPDHLFRLVNGFNSCHVTAGKKGDPNRDIFFFTITLGEYYDDNSKEKDKLENVGVHQVYQQRFKNPPVDTCYYNLPYEKTDFAVTLKALRSPPRGTADRNWPERCQIAKEYLGSIADNVLALPPREKAPEGRTLIGKDPCAQRNELAALLPDWTPGSPKYLRPYNCELPFTKQSEPYTLTMKISWDLNVEPSTKAFSGQTAKRIHIGDLGGVQLVVSGLDNSDGGSCSNSMTLQPSDQDVTDGAHLIHVGLATKTTTRDSQTSVPAASCDQVDKATEIVLRGIGS